jgi:peptidyl-prolyl isomerase D
MNIVRKIENCEKGSNDKPVEPVLIEASGELAPGEDDGIPVRADGDIYEDYPEDYKGSKEPEDLLRIAGELKVAGNANFKKGDVAAALESYSKGVRYLDELHPNPADIDVQELSLEKKRDFYSLRTSLMLNSAMVTFFSFHHKSQNINV